MPRRDGYTKAELLVVLAVIVVLSSFVFLVLGGEKRRVTDANQLRELHAAMVVFATEHADRYPTPGIIWLQPIDLRGDGNPVYIPMAPRDDQSKNTTASLYSAMIAREYIKPNMVVSPRERNPAVQLAESYSYAEYKPREGRFWDEAFLADLTSVSNTSYAHLLIHGARKRLRWRNTADPNTPILSNRGPRDGMPDPQSFTTRRDGSWAGFVVFADNSVQWLNTVTPENVLYEPNIKGGQRVEKVPDNIFAAEFNDDWTNPPSPLGSNDAYLTFTLRMDGPRNQETPVIQHD